LGETANAYEFSVRAVELLTQEWLALVRRDRSHPCIVASAGSDSNPAWFHNIVANPHDVGVEVGTANLSADAEVLPEPDRAAVFAEQARRFSGFAHYQSMTQRPIPVVGLTLKSAASNALDAGVERGTQ